MIVLSLIQSFNADCFLPSFFKLDWSSPILRTDHIGEGITRQHFVRVRCCCWVALRFYITCHLLREVVVKMFNYFPVFRGSIDNSPCTIFSWCRVPFCFMLTFYMTCFALKKIYIYIINIVDIIVLVSFYIHFLLCRWFKHFFHFADQDNSIKVKIVFVTLIIMLMVKIYIVA